MTILFGHPSGNPNSHNAALAHYEAGWLEAFCVPWMPTELEIGLLERIPGVKHQAARLRRRRFAPLDAAPKVQGRFGEWDRMFKRMVGGAWADERLSYQANDWLMRVMARECRRGTVTAVHAYEDCALLQFQEAERLGKRRIYDLPIGYYPAWESVHKALIRQYEDWLPRGAAGDGVYVRPEQKHQEMALADLVMVPSSFVQRTVRQYSDRPVAVAPYGVDADFWSPGPARRGDGPFRFLFAGQCSIRKGTPLLLQAWKAAALDDAVLEMVGTWRLADSRKRELPAGVDMHEPVAPDALRERIRRADVLVLPSYFEGLALVILEAMACGLPVIATDATGGADVIGPDSGVIIPAGDLDALVASLRWAGDERQRLSAMRTAARRKAESMSWTLYRERVRQAVAPMVGGA